MVVGDLIRIPDGNIGTIVGFVSDDIAKINIPGKGTVLYLTDYLVDTKNTPVPLDPLAELSPAPALTSTPQPTSLFPSKRSRIKYLVGLPYRLIKSMV